MKEVKKAANEHVDLRLINPCVRPQKHMPVERVDRLTNAFELHNKRRHISVILKYNWYPSIHTRDGWSTMGVILFVHMMIG